MSEINNLLKLWKSAFLVPYVRYSIEHFLLQCHLWLEFITITNSMSLANMSLKGLLQTPGWDCSEFRDCNFCMNVDLFIFVSLFCLCSFCFLSCSHAILLLRDPIGKPGFHGPPYIAAFQHFVVVSSYLFSFFIHIVLVKCLSFYIYEIAVKLKTNKQNKTNCWNISCNS